MIQLASDPNAGRVKWQPAQPEGKEPALQGGRGRTGHAWPFISRYGEKPEANEPAKQKPGEEHHGS